MPKGVQTGHFSGRWEGKDGIGAELTRLSYSEQVTTGLPLETRKVDVAGSAALGPRPSLSSPKATSLYHRLPFLDTCGPLLPGFLMELRSSSRTPGQSGTVLSSTDSSATPPNRVKYGTGLGPGKGALHRCGVGVQETRQKEERTQNKVSGG